MRRANRNKLILGLIVLAVLIYVNPDLNLLLQALVPMGSPQGGIVGTNEHFEMQCSQYIREGDNFWWTTSVVKETWRGTMIADFGADPGYRPNWPQGMLTARIDDKLVVGERPITSEGWANIEGQFGAWSTGVGTRWTLDRPTVHSSVITEELGPGWHNITIRAEKDSLLGASWYVYDPVPGPQFTSNWFWNWNTRQNLGYEETNLIAWDSFYIDPAPCEVDAVTEIIVPHYFESGETVSKNALEFPLTRVCPVATVLNAATNKVDQMNVEYAMVIKKDESKKVPPSTVVRIDYITYKSSVGVDIKCLPGEYYDWAKDKKCQATGFFDPCETDLLEDGTCLAYTEIVCPGDSIPLPDGTCYKDHCKDLHSDAEHIKAYARCGILVSYDKACELSGGSYNYDSNQCDQAKSYESALTEDEIDAEAEQCVNFEYTAELPLVGTCSVNPKADCSKWEGTVFTIKNKDYPACVYDEDLVKDPEDVELIYKKPEILEEPYKAVETSRARSVGPTVPAQTDVSGNPIGEEKEMRISPLMIVGGLIIGGGFLYWLFKK